MANEIGLSQTEIIDIALKLGVPNPEDVVEIGFEDIGDGRVKMVAIYAEGKRQHPDRIEL